jgi:DNA-binding transcriptional ArsR family regulator
MLRLQIGPESLSVDILFICNNYLAHEIEKGHMARRTESGEDLLLKLTALASPHRMRIVAELEGGRNYVSELARVVGLSRPLLQMHLSKLEAAGLVKSRLELSSDGKAMKFYELVPFSLALTPGSVADAAAKLRLTAGRREEEE